MKEMTNVPLAALRAAFSYTVPILAIFFLGIAYGIYMNALGFSFLYPMAMSAIIFGGSLEFIATVLLLGCLILRPIIERRETA